MCFVKCSFWHRPKKEPNPDYGFCEFFGKNFTKPLSGLVRFILSPRESQKFRPLRKAMKVAHFGFPPPPVRKADWPARLLDSKPRFDIRQKSKNRKMVDSGFWTNWNSPFLTCHVFVEKGVNVVFVIVDDTIDSGKWECAIYSEVL